MAITRFRTKQVDHVAGTVSRSITRAMPSIVVNASDRILLGYLDVELLVDERREFDYGDGVQIAGGHQVRPAGEIRVLWIHVVLETEDCSRTSPMLLAVIACSKAQVGCCCAGGGRAGRRRPALAPLGWL